MKLRDRVGELIEKNFRNTKEANDIFTKNKHFNLNKELKMIYKVHWIVDGTEIEAKAKKMKKCFKRTLKIMSKNLMP